MSRAQWEPGEAVHSVEALYDLIHNGRALFHRDKLYTHGWYLSWPLRAFRNASLSRFRYARCRPGCAPDSVKIKCSVCGTGHNGDAWADRTAFCHVCQQDTAMVPNESRREREERRLAREGGA